MDRYRLRGTWSPFLLLLAVTSLPGNKAFATGAVTLYSTQFEQPAYDPAFTLAGQHGWEGSDDSSTCNGLVSGRLTGLGQHAYLGFFPADPGLTSYNVWQPINLSPVPTNRPVIKFSVQMAIVDSSTTNRDCFRWSVYNVNQKRLFTLDFDNEALTINYLLEDAPAFVSTGREFVNDTQYALTIAMDFGLNTWSASLDGAPVVSDQPITTANSALNLGDVDAVWVYRHSTPGDNWMVFDNYTITSEARQVPVLTALGQSNGQFLARVSGERDRNYAVEVTTNLTNWTPLRTNNTSSAGFFDFVDSTGSPRRFYRARLVP